MDAKDGRLHNEGSMQRVYYIHI